MEVATTLGMEAESLVRQGLQVAGPKGMVRRCWEVGHLDTQKIILCLDPILICSRSRAKLTRRVESLRRIALWLHRRRSTHSWPIAIRRCTWSWVLCGRLSHGRFEQCFVVASRLDELLVELLKVICSPGQYIDSLLETDFSHYLSFVCTSR